MLTSRYSFVQCFISQHGHIDAASIICNHYTKAILKPFDCKVNLAPLLLADVSTKIRRLNPMNYQITNDMNQRFSKVLKPLWIHKHFSTMNFNRKQGNTRSLS
ncbi:hypothetical protein D3C73_1329720 [compost metagenome]